MTFHLKVVEQYFTVMLFIFQFYPVYNLGKFIYFGLSTARSKRVKKKCTNPTNVLRN